MVNDDSDDERFDLDRFARAWSWVQLGLGIGAGLTAATILLAMVLR